MVVVHDWDHPFPGKKDALKRSFKLFVYVLSRYLPFLKRFCKEIYEENKMWNEIYSELEKLQNVKAVYGIRSESRKEFGKFIKKLEKEQDVRLHLHSWVKGDRKKFKEKFGHDMAKEKAVAWIPALDKKGVTLRHNQIDFMDWPNSTEEQLKRLGKDAIVIFHPENRDRSLLLYLKFLNQLKRKNK